MANTKKTEVHLFVDTNILLEYKPLKDIDLCSLLDAEKVVVCLTATVTKELDKHKTGANRRLRDRARAAYSLMNDTLKEPSKQIRPSTTLKMIVDSPLGFEDYGFDRENLDDRLILNAIEHKKVNPDTPVAFLSGDMGARAKAAHYQLLAIEPDDAWILPAFIDEIQKENNELKKQIERKPKLRISFADNKTFVQKTLLGAPDSNKSTVQTIMSKYRQSYPYLHPVNDDISKILGGPRNVSRYASELNIYFKNLEETLSSWLDVQQILARTVKLNLFLQNLGNEAATKVRCRLIFPANAKLSKKPPELPDMPEAPLKPAPGEDPFIMRMLAQQASQKLDLGPFIKSNPVAVTSGLKIDGHEAIYWRNELPHRDKAIAVPDLYISFADRAQANSFQFTCESICNETADSRTTQFQVELRKSPDSIALSFLMGAPGKINNDDWLKMLD